MRSGVKAQTQRGKRRSGRRRSARKAGERATLSLRVTAELFAKLDAEAKGKGRALSNEAEIRLERSFENERVAEYFSEAYFGRELSALLEVIGRAMRDAGTHAASWSARANLGSPNWLENPFGFAIAVEAATRVLDAIRPPAKIEAPPTETPAEARLAEGIANGLLYAIGRGAAWDVLEPWAAGIRARLGPLRARLNSFEYDFSAVSAVLPSPVAPGVLGYDSNDQNLLKEKQ